MTIKLTIQDGAEAPVVHEFFATKGETFTVTFPAIPVTREEDEAMEAKVTAPIIEPPARSATRERIHAVMRKVSKEGCCNLPTCAFRDDICSMMCDALVTEFESVEPPAQPGVPVGFRLGDGWVPRIPDAQKCGRFDCDGPARFGCPTKTSCLAHAIDLGALVPVPVDTQRPASEQYQSARDFSGRLKPDAFSQPSVAPSEPVVDWSRFVPREKIPQGAVGKFEAGAVYQTWNDGEGAVIRWETIRGSGNCKYLAGRYFHAAACRLIRHADGRWAAGFNPSGPCEPGCGTDDGCARTEDRPSWPCHRHAGLINMPCFCTPFCRDRHIASQRPTPTVAVESGAFTITSPDDSLCCQRAMGGVCHEHRTPAKDSTSPRSAGLVDQSGRDGGDEANRNPAPGKCDSTDSGSSDETASNAPALPGTLAPGAGLGNEECDANPRCANCGHKSIDHRNGYDRLACCGHESYAGLCDCKQYQRWAGRGTGPQGDAPDTPVAGTARREEPPGMGTCEHPCPSTCGTREQGWGWRIMGRFFARENCADARKCLHPPAPEPAQGKTEGPDIDKSPAAVADEIIEVLGIGARCLGVCERVHGCDRPLQCTAARRCLAASPAAEQPPCGTFVGPFGVLRYLDDGSPVNQPAATGQPPADPRRCICGHLQERHLDDVGRCRGKDTCGCDSYRSAAATGQREAAGEAVRRSVRVGDVCGDHLSMMPDNPYGVYCFEPAGHFPRTLHRGGGEEWGGKVAAREAREATSGGAQFSRTPLLGLGLRDRDASEAREASGTAPTATQVVGWLSAEGHQDLAAAPQVPQAAPPGFRVAGRSGPGIVYRKGMFIRFTREVNGWPSKVTEVRVEPGPLDPEWKAGCYDILEPIPAQPAAQKAPRCGARLLDNECQLARGHDGFTHEVEGGTMQWNSAPTPAPPTPEAPLSERMRVSLKRIAIGAKDELHVMADKVEKLEGLIEGMEAECVHCGDVSPVGVSHWEVCPKHPARDALAAAKAEADTLRDQLVEARANVERVTGRQRELEELAAVAATDRDKWLNERVAVGNELDLHMAGCRREADNWQRTAENERRCFDDHLVKCKAEADTRVAEAVDPLRALLRRALLVIPEVQKQLEWDIDRALGAPAPTSNGEG